MDMLRTTDDSDPTRFIGSWEVPSSLVVNDHHDKMTEVAQPNAHLNGNDDVDMDASTQGPRFTSGLTIPNKKVNTTCSICQ